MELHTPRAALQDGRPSGILLAQQSAAQGSKLKAEQGCNASNCRFPGRAVPPSPALHAARSCCPKLHGGTGRSRPCPAPRGRARGRCRQKRNRNGMVGAGTGNRARDPGCEGGDAGQGGMRTESNEEWEERARWDAGPGQGGTETLGEAGWGSWLGWDGGSGRCGMQTLGRVEWRRWARKLSPIPALLGAWRELSPVPTWPAGAGPDAAGTPRPRPPLAFPPSPLRFHH